MIDAIFIKLLNMSFSASFVILAVYAARCLLTKTSKTLHYALWSVVLFRLLCPLSIESAFSLLPIRAEVFPAHMVYAQKPQIHSGLAFINAAVNPLLPAGEPLSSINPLQVWLFFGQIIWLSGATLLVLPTLYAYFRLRPHLKNALPLQDNIYTSDTLPVPFVSGLIHPKIYLPTSGLTVAEQPYVILHEQMHIRRFDPLIKTLAFAALILHWFNPLVWATFFSCMKDMELSCDELVLKKTDADIRRQYASSLLRLASDRSFAVLSPLGFSESGTKTRVKHIMRYKRPSAGRTATFACLVVTIVFCLLLSPKADTNLPLGAYAETPLYADSVFGGTLYLQPDNRFQFMYSPLSSYLPIGSYQPEGNRLICRTDDETRVYVFDIEENTLHFVPEASSNIATDISASWGSRTYVYLEQPEPANTLPQ